MSYRDAKEYIHEHFMLQLKEAQFDTKEKGLAGKISCAECPKRTGNQKELFEDVNRADVCTDPACFEAKKNAFTQRTIAKMKAQKKAVLSQDEAKKLFRYQNDETPEHKYTNLEDQHYYGGKYRDLRGIARATKDLEIVHAVQPYSGKIIQMVKNEDVPRILKNAGIKPGSDGSSGRDAKSMAQAKKQNRVKEAKRGFWISKVSIAKDRRCMNVVILDILLHDLGIGVANSLLPFKTRESYYRSWDIPKLYELGDDAVQKLIVKVISKKSEYLLDDDLKFLCGELGFDMSRDYVITETYLNAMTKDELVKLAKEIGMIKALEEKNIDCSDMGSVKKKALVQAFLTWNGLKGKIPKELSGSKKRK